MTIQLHQSTGSDQAAQERPSGAQAVLGAILALVGVLAAAQPANPVLKAIGEAAPQLVHALPTVITACGAVIAAFSSPPKLRGKP